MLTTRRTAWWMLTAMMAASTAFGQTVKESSVFWNAAPQSDGVTRATWRAAKANREAADAHAALFDAIREQAGQTDNDHDAWRSLLEVATADRTQCRTCHDVAAVEAGAFAARGLVLTKQLQEPWLGVTVGPVDEVLRAQLGIASDRGVVVTSVVPDSPAAQANIVEHDIILTINNRPIATGDDLDAAIKTETGYSESDDEWGKRRNAVRVAMIHQGQRVESNVVVVSLNAKNLVTIYGEKVEVPFRIGVQIAEPDATLRTHLDLAEEQGVVVTSVIEQSPAAEAGIQPNDVITTLNDQPVNGLVMLIELIRDSQGGPVRLGLIRAGKPMHVEVTPRRFSDAADSTTEEATPIVVGYDTVARVLMSQYNTPTGDGILRSPLRTLQTAPYPDAIGAGRAVLFLDQSGSIIPVTGGLGAIGVAAPPPSFSDQLNTLSQQIQQLQATLDALKAHLPDASQPQQNGAPAGSPTPPATP